MKIPTSFYPRVHTDAAGAGVVSSAGVVLLVEAVRARGLDIALSQELERWRKPTAVHDPAKILLDLASPWLPVGTAWPTSRCCAGTPASSGPGGLRPHGLPDDHRAGQ